MENNEIDPPWIKYPGLFPADPFWRQAGEAWFKHLWEPFWRALSSVEQEEYLRKYEVPDDWDKFYFNTNFQNWLDSVDEEDD